MNNICEELALEVKQSKKFNDEYKNLCIRLAHEQIKHIPGINFESAKNFDLHYLLKCANIFIQTDNNDLKEKVLRIAQYTFEYGQQTEKDYAYILVDSLLNNPSINLAKKNQLLNKNIEYYLPLKLSLQKLKRENEYSVEVRDDVIICNPFQKQFIEETSKSNCKLLSVSAPTSTGKSFIVTQWIIKNLEFTNKNNVNIAIIVPTRALINQYEKDLIEDLKNDIDKVHIETMPFRNGNILGKKKVIYVFTQERMNAFLIKNKSTKFKILFIDEAQKIGDGQRGILLEAVIEKIRNNSLETKIVFASPFVKNPQNIYPNTKFIKSNLVTINQNFFKIEKIKGKPLEWNVLMLYNEEFIVIAKITIPEKIKGTSIPTILANFVNLITINHESNNLIYANYPSDAEKIAELIYEKSTYNVEKNDEIIKLIQLCKETVHKNFNLIKYLKKGIAFHYGNMPQLIRLKIEDLFNKKIIRNLICTSTLLEGVNLSCKNIFIKNPKRSKSLKMTTSDLFNLAGRAGRLGKEFYGNIFYVDWDNAPVKKEETKVERSVQKVLYKNFTQIIQVLQNDFENIEFDDVDERNNVEATIGYLYMQFLKYGDIGRSKEVKIAFEKDEIILLNNALNKYSKKIEIPKCILEKHPIIYHYSMQKLLNYFRKRHPEEPKRYLVDFKNDNKITGSFISFLSRMKICFNTNLINEKHIKYISLLTSRWIKFKNFSVIIDARRECYKNEDFDLSVRHVFKDIDNYARYLVPKLLRCYIDVLNFYYEQSGDFDLIYDDNDIEALLEYGIENKTQMSMITLGLSRSTIVKLFDIKTEAGQYLVDNIEMDEISTLKWLHDNIKYFKTNKKLPELLIEEIQNILYIYKEIFL